MNALLANPRLETRELAYFVAVAEELHFGRAAERLGIAKPPLSRSISLLERRVGVQLLERTSRRVVLTAAGETFLVEARAVLAGVDTAVRQARRAAAGEPLIVAVRPGSGTELVAQIMRRYREQWPERPVEIVFTREQVRALRDGEADVALVCGREDLSGLGSLPLLETDPVALLPRGHDLARRRWVTLAQLAAQPGFRDEAPPLAMEELLDLVGFGQLIAVVGRTAAQRLDPGVVAVPVADLSSTVLHLAWRDGRAAAARHFAQTAQLVVAAESPVEQAG